MKASSSAGRIANGVSPSKPQPSSEQEPASVSESLDTAAADISHFLQPSFDAAKYVASLLRDVDTSFTASNEPLMKASTSGNRLQVLPASPTAARKSSVSLSPITPTPHDTDPGARKREQAQEDLDLSLAISRLNLAIEELDRSISSQVDAHAPALLRRTSNLALMQTGVGETRKGMENLDEEVARLRRKVHDPFVRLVELQAELRVFDGADELVRRTGGLVGLARRLESQMEVVFARKDASKDRTAAEEGEAEDAVVGQVHGRDLSRAALLVSEITSLLDAERQAQVSPSLLDLKLIQDLLPAVESARKTIIDYMEDMIVRGLRDLSPLMLSSSLQTAFNLRMLPTLVQDLLNDLTEAVKERTTAAFDLDSISRQLNLPLPSLENPFAPSYSTYRGSRRSGNNNEDELRQAHLHQQQKWSDAIWSKLESLIVVEMGAVCSKVYMLEKVLKLKSDSETGTNFLSAALEVLGDKPSYTFWLTFAQSLQQQLASATAKSAWMTQLLSTGLQSGVEGYPKLVRMFHEFFAKISVYTDVQYGATHQSAETVILIKSLGKLESVYVERCASRIGGVLHQVGGGGAKGAVVGEEEAETVVRSVANVLDTTRFDPLLSRAVLAECVRLVNRFVARLDAVVAKEEAAWALGGDRATQAQIWNAGLVRFAFALSQGLASVAADQEGSALTAATAAAVLPTTSSHAATQLTTLAQAIMHTTRTSLLHPLLETIRSTISSTMNKMHVQLAASPSTSSSQVKAAARGVSIDATSGASAYASSICNALGYLRERLLPLYPAELRTAMAGLVAKCVVEHFCLHASIFGFSEWDDAEGIKLRMATDMTELEFGLSQLVGDQRAWSGSKGWIAQDSGGEQRLVADERNAWTKTIRAFRRLLFLSLDEVESEVQKNLFDGLPGLLVMLHLLSRTPVVMENVIQQALAASTDAKSKDARSDFVKWALQGDDARPKVDERIAEIAAKEGDDEQVQRIVERLIAH